MHNMLNPRDLVSRPGNMDETVLHKSYEPRHEKTAFFANAKTKTQFSCAVTAQLIIVFDFPYMDITILLLPKSEISSLFSPSVAVQSGFVEPGRKPRSPVFLQRGSILTSRFGV